MKIESVSRKKCPYKESKKFL